MGCDSHLYLPPSTRMRDFEDVLGILLGCEAKQYSIAGSSGVFVRVLDAPHFSTSHTPEMAVLNIGGHWHWECEHSLIPGARMFSCSTQMHRRTILESLAEIFGGYLDFNDCDSVDCDYMGTLYGKSYRPDATDDAAWDAWQTFKLNLIPIEGAHWR
jgi:hypothetical protein